ncbi:FKBP-type peptidyl-prolyl cis-trans isomerase [Paraferrimonas sedimenticola]|uniref:Peptidyl-prolyl cis-trans isomerase n=1 Tax=Paraferrimonas sedimenticola TaxID=375674 RepID=A0AA37RXA8_9GAMM|nr:FKBP-type peptidyl-prolyl cis-trans isomerase [Paraferrimonas sedimenticola]GLP97146.1 peptidyl-prolyl cis-trans isomerase [Paraferrimonas sedimenticola]
MRSLLCHMTLLLEDGSTADSTQASGKPAKLVIGDESLSPAFEAEIQSLAAGDKHSFTLAAADAFGESNPDNVHHVERSRFQDVTPEVGAIIGFSSPAGEMPGIIREVTGDSVTVDFNHPLAGHEITFELEVLEVA